MVNRDKSGSFTIEQLKQQYNLDNKKTNKAIEQQNDSLIKVENELNNYIKQTTKELELIQDQVDGNITTWFFDGVPTLSNEPASNWTTEEEKNNHLGDLYYDSNTGYSYRFTFENSAFSWIKLKDSDITEALALANTAQDTADSKRRVFITTPTPPYDSGDFWINNNEIYICQVGRQTGEFIETDFINSLKYTDDTFAQEVDNKLTVVSGKVTTIEEGIDEITTTIEENKYFVNEDGEQQLISESMSEVVQSVDGLEVAIEEFDTNLGENYYTKENIDNLLIDSETGITNTLTSIGGYNLIRNSALLFPDENGFEYWEGNLEKGDEDESETGTSLLIQNQKASQTIYTLAGEYYLSFKYKKLIELSTLSIFVNEEEHQLLLADTEIPINEEREFRLLINIDSPNIALEFSSSTNNGVEVYDLMLNKGTVKALYSQHQNEITTNTVKIGKGVLVESNLTNTITKIDADGQRTLNKTTGEVVNRNTDTGTLTKTLTVEKESTLGILFLQQIGEETWITGL